MIIDTDKLTTDDLYRAIDIVKEEYIKSKTRFVEKIADFKIGDIVHVSYKEPKAGVVAKVVGYIVDLGLSKDCWKYNLYDLDTTTHLTIDSNSSVYVIRKIKYEN